MIDDARPTWIPQWSLADRLRKIRRDSHLSQEDFAHALGLKPTTYAAFETGRNVPRRVLELAGTIQDVFDVPAAWTLGVLDNRPTRGGDRVAAMQPQRRRATDRVVCV